MNVLSLFDGISCGQQALERAGIIVDKYFASEIDKYAIKVTMANYPNTIQLGSVVNVNGYDLPKIDLLIGGSPCQSFSFAGKRKGMATKDEVEILTLEHYLQLKNEGYEFEGQSYLFWEYMRLLNETKPKYFLLENVEMGEKWERVLSKAIGVNGIHINSALVSAQSRKRIYWTNIGMKPAGLFGDLESIIQQPKDRGILLKDILETEVDEKYFLSEKLIKGFESHAIRHKEKGIGFGFEIKNIEKKSNTLRANAAICATDNMIQVDDKIIHERLYNTLEKNIENIDNGTFIDSYNQSINNEKSNAIRTTVNSSNLNYVVGNKEEIISGQLRTFKDKEGFNENKSGKAFSILARARQDGSGQNVVIVHNIQQRSPNRPSLQKNKNAGGSGHLSKMDGKTYTLDTGNSNAIEIVAVRGRGEDNIPNIEPRNDGKTNNLTSVSKDNYVRKIMQLSNNNKSNGDSQPYQQDRIYDINGISPALDMLSSKKFISLDGLNENQLKKFDTNIDSDKANTLTLAQGRAGSSTEYMDSVSKIAKITSNIRRLTCVECERLQTIPDNYTNHVSDSQRYKMLGNGWTVEVIVHIFNYMK
jgi:DNA-cytosine methyltransferase